MSPSISQGWRVFKKQRRVVLHMQCRQVSFIKAKDKHTHTHTHLQQHTYHYENSQRGLGVLNTLYMVSHLLCCPIQLIFPVDWLIHFLVHPIQLGAEAHPVRLFSVMRGRIELSELDSRSMQWGGFVSSSTAFVTNQLCLLWGPRFPTNLPKLSQTFGYIPCQPKSKRACVFK